MLNFEEKCKELEQQLQESNKTKSDIETLENLNKEKIDTVVKLTKERDDLKRSNDHLKMELIKQQLLVKKIEESGVAVPTQEEMEEQDSNSNFGSFSDASEQEQQHIQAEDLNSDEDETNLPDKCFKNTAEIKIPAISMSTPIRSLNKENYQTEKRAYSSRARGDVNPESVSMFDRAPPACLEPFICQNSRDSVLQETPQRTKGHSVDGRKVQDNIVRKNHVYEPNRNF
jgi:hypothetical protein